MADTTSIDRQRENCRPVPDPSDAGSQYDGHTLPALINQPKPLIITTPKDSPTRVRLFGAGDQFIVEAMGAEIPFKVPLDRIPRKNELPLAFATLQVGTKPGSNSHVTLRRRLDTDFTLVSRITFGETDYGFLEGINPSTPQDHIDDALHFFAGIQMGMLIGTATKKSGLHIQTPIGSSTPSSDPKLDTPFATQMIPYALQFYRSKWPQGHRESIKFPYSLGNPVANLKIDKPQLEIKVTGPGMFGSRNLGTKSLELLFDLDQRTTQITTPATGKMELPPRVGEDSLRESFWNFLGIYNGLTATILLK